MQLPVQIWSDIACPWCFVGKKRLEAAAAAVGIELELTFRSFELDPRPTAREYEGLDYVGRLAAKYHVSRSHADNMVGQMRSVGAELGIKFDFERAVWANTFEAHRLLHLARRHGKGSSFKTRLLRAHFEEGVDLGDSGELLRLAGQEDLDVDEASAVLHSDDFAADVRAEEDQARQLGISGVPYFVIGGRSVGGAQQQAIFERVLREVLAEQAAEALPEGSFCDPEGC